MSKKQTKHDAITVKSDNNETKEYKENCAYISIRFNDKIIEREMKLHELQHVSAKCKDSTKNRTYALLNKDSIDLNAYVSASKRVYGSNLYSEISHTRLTLTFEDIKNL